MSNPVRASDRLFCAPEAAGQGIARVPPKLMRQIRDSARTYGKYENGVCVLGYVTNLFDGGGEVTGVQFTADSYEVENFSVPGAPPLVVSAPQGVEFYVTPMGEP